MPLSEFLETNAESIIERRSMKRFDVVTPATIGVSGDMSEPVKIYGKTQNLSAGGAYIETNQQLGLGVAVTVNLLLGENFKRIFDEQKEIEISGEVVRLGEDGVAIQFSK